MLQNLFGFLSTLFLHLVPHRPLARVAYRLTRVRTPAIKNILIRVFVFFYRVDMREAEAPDVAAYPDFNTFFVRALRPGARPLVSGQHDIAVPADSVVSARGELRDERLIQAKGIDYTARALLADESGEWAAALAGGRFATLYLSPRDYHRVHMPLDGRLIHMRYVPGQLYSVNDYSTRHVQGLFTRNERLVTIFHTAAGPMAFVMVGAMFVAGMETVWTGALSHRAPHGHWQPDAGKPVELARGAELGRFNMGSTVIVLFGPGLATWSDTLIPGAHVRMGSLMGRLSHPQGTVIERAFESSGHGAD